MDESRSFALSEGATTALSDAESAVVAAQAHVDRLGVSTIAVQLLRSEAIASSQIEGVSTPGHRALARALVKADGDDQRVPTGPAAAAIANVRAIRSAYERAVGAGPMTVADTKAPDFTLPNQEGEPVVLSALRGETVVVYFYPKADTPG